jgi:hypothetical protein
MFRSERQQCQAIRLLLSGLNLEYLWTETGPTDQACKWVKRNPLSSGESILLRAAFDLWNGEGKVTLWQIQGTLDQRHCERLFSLALAAGGSRAAEAWMRSERRPPNLQLAAWNSFLSVAFRG